MVAMPYVAFESLPVEDRYSAGMPEAKRLGKSAKTVSRSKAGKSGGAAARAARGITIEKDQPLHVRQRVGRLRRFQMQDHAARLAGTRLDRKNKMRQDR